MKLPITLSRLTAKLRAANPGFTMIELLIVIAILGILAVAVLAAINPVEQINRGRDTGTRSDAEQLISAMDRFNAFKGYMPWVTNAQDDFDIDPPVQITNAANAWDVTGLADCSVLERLSVGDDTVTGCDGTDELKSSFTQRVTADDYNWLYVYNAGEQGNSTYVCFEPLSKAFLDEAIDRCADTLPDDYPAYACDTAGDAATTTDDVLICLP